MPVRLINIERRLAVRKRRAMRKLVDKERKEKRKGGRQDNGANETEVGGGRKRGFFRWQAPAFCLLA